MELTVYALTAIVLAWLYQLIYVVKGSKNIQPLFVLMYACGVALLSADMLMENANSLPVWLNLGSLVIALAIFLRLYKKK